MRYELGGLASRELGDAFYVGRMVNHGWLLRIHASSQPQRLLNAYVSDYLQQEIAAESLVRNLSAFSNFLSSASLSDSEIVNQVNIASECGVSSRTVGSYFEILTDTLLANWVPAYTKRPKRRVIQSPRFYFSDVGVVNSLARRGKMEVRYRSARSGTFISARMKLESERVTDLNLIRRTTPEATPGGTGAVWSLERSGQYMARSARLMAWNRSIKFAPCSWTLFSGPTDTQIFRACFDRTNSCLR